MRDSMRRVKVALIEDHAGTREALARTLSTFSSSVELVAELPTAEAFFRSSAKHDIDVALFDLGLPGMSGCDAIQMLSAEIPRVRSIALTVFDDEVTVLDAMRAGAAGYLLKDEPIDRLRAAIEESFAGAHPLSSRVAGFLIEQARLRPPAVVLTDREEEVALALVEGLSYAACAERLGLAVGTVQEYVKRIYRKLDVRSKRELRAWLSRQRYPLSSARSRETTARRS